MHVDFGTGDGAFVRATAARHPDRLVIGVDATADALRAASRRIAAKPARGGLPNALLGRLSLDDAPGELAGLADALTVLLPWGSLLAAVARPEARGLAALRALCKPAAEVRVLFGYDPATDAAAIRDLGLPPLDDAATAATLEQRYREAGFLVSARPADVDDVRTLPTTWAKRLSHASRGRRYLDVRGRVP